MRDRLTGMAFRGGRSQPPQIRSKKRLGVRVPLLSNLKSEQRPAHKVQQYSNRSKQKGCRERQDQRNSGPPIRRGIINHPTTDKKIESKVVRPSSQQYPRRGEEDLNCTQRLKSTTRCRSPVTGEKGRVRDT